MKLFSDKVRSYMGPADASESLYLWLDRSGRPTAARGRELLEKWFANYPDDNQPDLSSRFRDPHGIEGAFFELYMHELLVRLGYTVDVHPVKEGDAGPRPDFLLSNMGEPEFYVEAKVVTEVSDAEASAEARMNIVYETLGRMDSPDYFVGIDISGNPRTPPPGAKMRRAVKSWLSKLDYNEIAALYARGRFQAMPRLPFEHDGLTVSFFPIPKTKKLRGTPEIRPIGIRQYSAVLARSDEAIRDAIGNKVGQLPDLGKPYVIAINALQLHADQEDVLAALFGIDDPVAITCLGVTSPDPRGVFYFHGAPANTRVSAVLVVLALSLWTIASSDLRLYPNPWASNRYCGKLCRLPRATVDRRLEQVDGIHPREIFSLSNRWYDDTAANKQHDFNRQNTM